MNGLTSFCLVVSILMGMNATAQLSIDADLRIRDEYSHGSRTLIDLNSRGVNTVSQRMRLNSKYVNEDMTIYLAFQNIRTWGDVAQLNYQDVNGISTHQAWVQFPVYKNVELRAGRQEIVLDNARIMGNVDWAQQGRSHDAVVLKYAKGNHHADLGYALRKGTQPLPDDFQYAWYNFKKDAYSLSFLLLNNGNRIANNEMLYGQTVGTYFKYGKGKMKYDASAYYQMGKDGADNVLNAYQVSLTSKFTKEKVLVGLGIELMSGNKSTVLGGVNKAFSPLYGTNHKYNGYMDYFYVGNHANSVGLRDVQFNLGYRINSKSKLRADLHNFAAASTGEGLGNEIDFSLERKLSADMTFKAGYSQLFATDAMSSLKGVSAPDDIQYWGWLMIIVNPNVFNGFKEKLH